MDIFLQLVCSSFTYCIWFLCFLKLFYYAIRETGSFVFYCILHSFLMFIYYLSCLRGRDTEWEQGKGREKEGNTESEAGFRPQAVSAGPNVGLEPMNCEIVTWAKVGRLTSWATQAPTFYILDLTVSSWCHLNCSSVPNISYRLEVALQEAPTRELSGDIETAVHLRFVCYTIHKLYCKKLKKTKKNTLYIVLCTYYWITSSLTNICYPTFFLLSLISGSVYEPDFATKISPSTLIQWFSSHWWSLPRSIFLFRGAKWWF